MFALSDLPEPCYRLDSDALLEAVGALGLSKPTLDDHRAATALAEGLMNTKVVSVETLQAVQAVQPAASLVYKEDGVVTGVAGQLMLRASAIAAFFEDRFSATDIDLDLLSREGELIAVGYGWGVAASTPAARQAIVTWGQLMRVERYPLMATFSRAVTEVGRHLAIVRYHSKPFRHPDDDLLLRLPCVEEQAASDAERFARAAKAARREPVAA